MQTNKTIFEEIIATIQRQEYEKAELMLEQYLAQIPCDPFALYLLGSLYLDVNRPGLAIALLSASANINPNFQPVFNNLGVALRTHGHEDAAKIAYEQAVKLDPNNAETLGNYSGLYVNAGEPDKAIELATKSLKIQDSAQARNHISIALLEKGELEDGFKQYHSRHELPGWHNRDYGCPEWDGKDTDLLVISGEQGLGDEILFMSWFAEARKRVKSVVIECAPRLIKLFERSFGVKCYPDEAAVVAECKPTAKVSMGDLPAVVGVENRSENWIKPDLDRVQYYREHLYELGHGPFVGISWKGGLAQTHKHLRNVSLEKWKPFINGSTISLQYGDVTEGAKRIGVNHWPEAIADLDELCALIAACDLVVSVCNTTIHMAGAMGIPVWILTPSKPAWRYGINGKSMTWYPSARLFRQKGDDWQSVYNEVEKELADFRTIPEAKRKVA